MTEVDVDRILREVECAERLREQLVLLVGPAGAGKTASLLALEARAGIPHLNINLLLSRRLLDLPLERRAEDVSDLLSDILDETDGPLLLDNLEILFDPTLQFQPLGWLRRTSRGRTIVAAWNGAVEHGSVTYATPGHPEYRREPADGIIVVQLGAAV